MLRPYMDACKVLRFLAEEHDLEKYFEVYEIGPSDLGDLETGEVPAGSEEAETLKSLKACLYRLHTIRRIFLCSLLALDADGGKPDFTRWGIAVHEMQRLASITTESTEKLNRILSEEERQNAQNVIQDSAMTDTFQDLHRHLRLAFGLPLIGNA